MTSRKRPHRSIEKDVVVAARRQCCLCVFLLGRTEPRKGQIAHLDRDPSNSTFDNLVYLCLEHHDEYDSSTSQSKGLLEDEVREYRDRLYAQNKDAPKIAKEAVASASAELEPLPEVWQYEVLRRRFPKKFKNSISPGDFHSGKSPTSRRYSRIKPLIESMEPVLSNE